MSAGSAITPAVQVTARDRIGTTTTTFTGSVTIAIGTNPPGGTLSGSATVAAVATVAIEETATPKHEPTAPVAASPEPDAPKDTPAAPAVVVEPPAVMPEPVPEPEKVEEPVVIDPAPVAPAEDAHPPKQSEAEVTDSRPQVAEPAAASIETNGGFPRTAGLFDSLPPIHCVKAAVV